MPHIPGEQPAAPSPPTDVSCAYLELLARGAPAEAYEEPLAEAREAGAPDAELAALRRGRELALRIRAEQEGRRRREAELTALIETVHDLAGVRGLDEVLRAIVQRARSLLGAELGYLALTDPDSGDSYMRVTVGSVSARFQQLRLGMGDGLGGLVAQTARPYASDDYPHDDRFLHTEPIDTAIGEEGLVSILGVPLLLGGDVIGVLYAAHRRARAFDREQVALLGSFAAHAAVALDNARLLTETREALAGLESANETIQRAGEVHDRLTELVLRGGDVDDVAAAVARVLDGEVEFLPPEEASALPAVERSRSAGYAVCDGDTWAAAVSVSAGGELLGALLLRGRPALAPVDQRTFERAAMVTSLLLLARRSADEAEQRVRGELLDDLLEATDRDPRLLRERAARLRADLDAPHVVLAARYEDGEDAQAGADTSGPSGSAARQRLWAAASHLAATRCGLAAAREGGTVLLLPVAGGEEGAASRVAAEAAAQLGAAVGGQVTVGASAPVPAPAAAPSAVAAGYAEARRCVAALRTLGRCGEGAAAGDFGFLGLLLTGEGTRDVAGFVRRTLGPVLDYDERRGTGLLATMDAYFASGMSPVKAKDRLHVHVNTVAQRLERVAQLLGEDWQSPQRALETQLALRLHRMSGALD
ncbi:GAF domain-containing protein [Streptomyces sp. ODS28]|uniref:helix-turn-helix domain-containing protein n=1 Tax=Streptomyces sp. ODS28 TaxID=3136688 RepID=UPI0031F0BA62